MFLQLELLEGAVRKKEPGISGICPVFLSNCKVTCIYGESFYVPCYDCYHMESNLFGIQVIAFIKHGFLSSQFSDIIATDVSFHSHISVSQNRPCRYHSIPNSHTPNRVLSPKAYI